MACTLPNNLGYIQKQDCIDSIGQIQVIIFGRVGQKFASLTDFQTKATWIDDTVIGVYDDTTDPTTVTNLETEGNKVVLVSSGGTPDVGWDGALGGDLVTFTSGSWVVQTAGAFGFIYSNISNQRLVVSPTINAPSLVAGEPQVFGQDSNETPNGRGFVTNEGASQFTASFYGIENDVVAQLRALKNENQLQAYFINTEGKLFYQVNASGEVFGFPIFSYNVSDNGTEDGFASPTTANLRFSLRAGWSEQLEKTSATDFDPLTDLYPIIA